MKSARWITARFESKCACGATLKKGDEILFHPSSKTAQCKLCGEKYVRELQAADMDEAAYNGQTW